MLCEACSGSGYQPAVDERGPQLCEACAGAGWQALPDESVWEWYLDYGGEGGA
jgi:DnaJ-class molecular chaperone